MKDSRTHVADQLLIVRHHEDCRSILDVDEAHASGPAVGHLDQKLPLEGGRALDLRSLLVHGPLILRGMHANRPNDRSLPLDLGDDSRREGGVSS